MQFQVISFDLFQTLVDVNKRTCAIWQGALGEDYTPKLAKRAADALLRAIPEAYRMAYRSPEFIGMEDFYRFCACRVIEETGVPAAADKIVLHILAQHARAPFFVEVLECVKQFSESCRLVLCSDASPVMLGEAVRSLPFEQIFLSEQLRCYKGEAGGIFFHRVCRKLGIQPVQLLHVGDSAADVDGAAQAGVCSCWLNRTGGRFTGAAAPDYEVRDLRGLADILSAAL